MKGQYIRIKLQAYDHRLLDQSVREIVTTAERSGRVFLALFPYQLVFSVLR